MSDKELFDDVENTQERASDWAQVGGSSRAQSKMQNKMEERGITPEEALEWIKEKYAPVSDDLKLGRLTPTMSRNLIKDIEEGGLG